MNLYIRSAIIQTVLLLMTLAPAVSMLFFSINTVSANPDTTWSVSFRLNMTKAVNNNIFSPDSDHVYLVMDGIEPLKLVQGPGYTYSVSLFNQLDSGVVYSYKFRINDSVWETVNRTFTPKPGMVDVSMWWNDEAVNYTTFIVNMKYAVQYSLFDPSVDSVSIVGTMNTMQGSPKMNRIDTTLNYAYVYSLDPGSIQQYKYRINLGDSATGQMELLYKPDRIIRIPDTLLEVTNDFNNFNPAKRLMTFKCDMSYYIEAHHFNMAYDYLDIAGNFNGFGANDALFDTNGDTIYTLETYMDTTWIHQGPLEFKFRINGDWNSAELTGKPNRTYAFHDTVNLNPNIFTCFYNDLNPSIPTPPWAYNVDIQGLLIYKKFLSGIYSYENVNGIPEGVSSYRWLRSNNSLGLDATPIDSALKITYVVDTLDIGKWLVFEVTPKGVSGDSAIGKPVRAVSSNSVSAWDVGMGERSALISLVYPNPAYDYITIETGKQMDRVEILSYLGKTVLIKEDIGSTSVRLPVGHLPKGFYLLKATAKSGEWGVARMIRN
ncbi:MAG: T9SS type A sorting domain-containing protein [Bacteroidales bacterium]|nr:T9SS type A sorting domain-containing protein [Bacteroidales bacterium]